MTARELVGAECPQLRPQVCKHDCLADSCPHCEVRELYAAAERVINLFSQALAEQTSRGNHHEERASEYAAEVERLTRERDDAFTRLRIEKECRTANKYAVVDTVGGVVEGHPTNELNYLQRLQELVEKEAENERLRALLRDIEWKAHTTRGHYCVWCGNYRYPNHGRHLPECAIRAALGEDQP